MAPNQPGTVMAGPLSGLRVIELAGIGPGPFCAMLLADLGAEILMIERPTPIQAGLDTPRRYDLTRRGRRALCLDLKVAAGRDAVLRLAGRSDVLIEGFRPGVAERLGIGPAPCHAANPRLVYGRMTGWGQDGPLAHTAGHDANYIALTGALHAIGPAEGPPTPPLNLIGDYGGGALFLAFGIMSALFEAQRSGSGQVVDAAMVDGAACLMTPFYGLHAAGLWRDARGANLLDGGAPFYCAYATSDGRHVAVAALEDRFYDVLVAGLGLDGATLPARQETANWPRLHAIFSTVFAGRTRDHWCATFDGGDGCVAPVLALHEAPAHAHNAARGTFVTIDGIPQPAPAPRFARTPAATPAPPPPPGRDTEAALADWGFSTAEIETLRSAGAIAGKRGWTKTHSSARKGGA
jgi:alpha-methylacyl-CoA racemase